MSVAEDAKRMRAEPAAEGQALQLYLKVNKGEAPRLVAQPADRKSYASDMVPLPGCIVESGRDWDMCDKVAEMCRDGRKLDETRKSALHDHLEDAYSILEDLMVLMGDESQIGYKTVYAILDRIRWFVVAAGKCVDLDLVAGD